MRSRVKDRVKSIRRFMPRRVVAFERCVCASYCTLQSMKTKSAPLNNSRPEEKLAMQPNGYVHAPLLWQNRELESQTRSLVHFAKLLAIERLVQHQEVGYSNRDIYDRSPAYLRPPSIHVSVEDTMLTELLPAYNVNPPEVGTRPSCADTAHPIIYASSVQ
jgi:hypothetical protein